MKKSKTERIADVIFVLGALIISVSVLRDACAPAKASTATIGVELAREVPAVGPAYADSYRVSCTTSPLSIEHPSFVNSSISIECEAPLSTETNATVLVGIGDSTVADPAEGTREGAVICGTGCHRAVWQGNARGMYCRADSGTVVLTCNALVPSTTPR